MLYKSCRFKSIGDYTHEDSTMVEQYNAVLLSELAILQHATKLILFYSTVLYNPCVKLALDNETKEL